MRLPGLQAAQLLSLSSHSCSALWWQLAFLPSAVASQREGAEERRLGGGEGVLWQLGRQEAHLGEAKATARCPVVPCLKQEQEEIVPRACLVQQGSTRKSLPQREAPAPLATRRGPA